MDLDNIKSSWNKPESVSATDLSMVKKIINGKAKTALERLITVETVLLILLLPLSIFIFIIDYLLHGIYEVSWFIKAGYVGFFLLGIFCQYYKRSLLKRVDIAHDNLTTCLKYILRYRLCIKIEIIIGTIFFFLLYIPFMYGWKDVMTEYQFEIYSRVNGVFIIFLMLLSFLFYKKVYYKQIKKIESAMKEIEQMENE